jgi:hypothetical protein
MTNLNGLSQTMAANLIAPSNATAIDLSSEDYEPGHHFVVYVDDTTSGTNVKVDTKEGSTITITSATEGERLGGMTGIVCKKVYETGTTADILIALY